MRSGMCGIEISLLGGWDGRSGASLLGKETKLDTAL